MRRPKLALLIGVSLLLGLLAGGYATAQETANVLEIHLASPGQGEIFYTAPTGVLTSVPVSGRVVSYEVPVDLSTVELTLNLIDADGEVVETQIPVAEDGYFHTWVTINTYTAVPTIEIHEFDLCLTCHEFGEVVMPTNVTQLLVHARTPDNLTGSVVRDIKLDHGEFRTLEVQVEGLPETSMPVQIVAGTTVYEWRPRSFFADVVDGLANVSIEGLTYADLSYEIMLTPIVIDATLYETEPQTLTLPAGSTVLPSVTLTARPVRGTIEGQVVTGMPAVGVEAASVLAVDLLTGSGYSAVTAEDGSFSLEDLPVSELVLLAQSSAGMHVPAQVDLRERVAHDTAIHLVNGGPDTLRGQVVLAGEPVPFAQALVEGLLPAQVDPLSGVFALAALPEAEPVEVTITAAGCYSQQMLVSERDLGLLALVLHPDTTVRQQGGARLYLPAETRATTSGDEVRLDEGVLWVVSQTPANAPGPTILAGDYRLSGQGASFAVEALPGALPRLYVRQGSVTAVHAERESMTVAEGQTLTLTGANSRPVDLAPGAGALLREIGGSVGRLELQPSVSERVQAALWQGMAAAARLLMLGAYAITFAGMPALVIAGIVMQLCRRATRRD
nr:hypothetical protein [Anaerolineae bacterium]